MQKRYIVLAAAAALLGVAGCGGSGGGSSAPAASRSGQLHFTVKWPTSTSRFIPALSNSITVFVKDSTNFIVAHTTLVHQSGATTAETTLDVPLTDFQQTFHEIATAYPSTDGSGVAQATGAMDVTVTAGQTTAATITMNTTISDIVITPLNPVIGPGQSVTFTATPRNAQGDQVLVAPGNIEWLVERPTIANGTAVGNTATITGLTFGTTRLYVDDKESGFLGTPAIITVVNGGAPGIYVADRNNNRIVYMRDITGNGWSTFGSGGNGTNQLNGPVDVYVAGDGKIYISDAANDRIIRMDDFTGKNWTAFGTFGSGTNQLNSPHGIFVDGSNRIYIADQLNNRVVRINDMSGASWTTFGTSGAGVNQLKFPSDVVVDSASHLFITDQGNGRIVRVDDMQGTNWKTLSGSGTDTLGAPFGVDVTGSIGVVTDVPKNRIAQFDAPGMSTSGWISFGSQGGGNGQFAGPLGIAFKGSQTYVADGTNNRIVRMDGNQGGGFVALGGSSGSGQNQFSHPVGVFVR